MQQVDTFGIHWDGPIAWLQQGRGGSNFLGLHKKSPFKNPSGACNHLVPVAAPIPDRVHWEALLKINDDPLVQAMLPVPKEVGSRLYYIVDPHDDLNLYISCLSRFSSPIRPVMKPEWMMTKKALERELLSTNIQPLVITQVKRTDMKLVAALAASTNYLPRTLILSGAGDIPLPPQYQLIETKIRDTDISDLVTLPLETIGATLIRRYMRNEDLFGPIESRQARRERLNQEKP